MLSKELRNVLDVLKEIVGDSTGYKVIDAEEIISSFKDGFTMTLEELSGAIKELKDREYLNLKFFTLEEYCLQVLPKEEELIQLVEEINEANGVEPKKEKVKKEKVVKASKVEKTVDNSKKNFVMGFLGSFLGGIVVTIITVIILVVAF